MSDAKYICPMREKDMCPYACRHAESHTWGDDCVRFCFTLSGQKSCVRLRKPHAKKRRR